MPTPPVVYEWKTLKLGYAHMHRCFSYSDSLSYDVLTVSIYELITWKFEDLRRIVGVASLSEIKTLITAIITLHGMFFFVF